MWRFLGCVVLVCAACTTEEVPRLGEPVPFDLPPTDVEPVALPSRIAFGSCSDPRMPMPALDVARGRDPHLFLFLGDNVYADTEDEGVMRSRYAELASAPAFRRLRDEVPLMATWDDHDYGQNDAGKSYPMRETSREIFLEFWEEPSDSLRWDRDGIYTARYFEEDGQRLQILVLDTRYNRDGLTRNDGSGINDYVPNADASTTLLGETQWSWLEAELLEPADLRVIASSIQFGHSYNGYESWTLFPHERERLISLIATAGAEGVMFVSGDVHWGEISEVQVPGGYALVDVTSSGINQDWPHVEANDNRLGEPVPDFNTGWLEIDWDARTVDASIVDVQGEERTNLALGFDELAF